jgi:hypothetical protein
MQLEKGTSRTVQQQPVMPLPAFPHQRKGSLTLPAAIHRGRDLWKTLGRGVPLDDKEVRLLFGRIAEAGQNGKQPKEETEVLKQYAKSLVIQNELEHMPHKDRQVKINDVHMHSMTAKEFLHQDLNHFLETGKHLTAQQTAVFNAEVLRQNNNEPLRKLPPEFLKDIPTAPPHVDLLENIYEAKAHYLNLPWFNDKVNYGGPWDYKTLDKNGKYEDFGNFHYGVVGKALGVPNSLLFRAAGAAQIYKGNATKPKWGSPWGNFPYGDDPKDQKQIIKGIEFYERLKKHL